MPLDLAPVPGERRFDRAVALSVVRVARDLLFQIFEPGYRRSRADFDVVLPSQLRLRRLGEKNARHHQVVRALAHL